MPARRTALGLAPVFLLLLGGAGLPALGAQDMAGSKVPPAPATTAAADDEKPLLALIQSALDGKVSGAGAYLKGKKQVLTSQDSAVGEALNRSLAIRFQEQLKLQSDAAVTSAKSAFDPVLTVAVSWGQVDTYDRKDTLVRERFNSDLLEKGIAETGTQFAALPQIIIDGQNFTPPADNSIDPFSSFPLLESASSRSMSQTHNASLTLGQNLPWGSALSASVSSTYIKEFLPVIPIMQRPWTTNYSVVLAVPFPWCKDFGRYGSGEAEKRLTAVAQERAFWTVRSTVNGALLNAGNAYWELVRNAKRLEVTVQIRKNVEDLAGKSATELAGGRTVKYDKAQMDAELARVKGVEESAWAAYVQSSNALRALLDYPRESALLPVGFSKRIEQEYAFKPEDVLHQAYAQNPDLRATQAGVDFAQVNRKFQANQARPDIKITGGLRYFQYNTVYGYRTVAESWSKFGNPDEKDHFVGLTYHVPWGNRPAQERLEESVQALRQAEKQLGIVSDQVEHTVNDSLAAVASRRKRVDIAKRNYETVRKAFDTARKDWMEEGRMPGGAARGYPAFELLRKNNDVLTAGFNLTDAQVDLREAERTLMAAQGLLYAKYAETTNLRLKAAVPQEKGGQP